MADRHAQEQKRRGRVRDPAEPAHDAAQGVQTETAFGAGLLDDLAGGAVSAPETSEAPAAEHGATRASGSRRRRRRPAAETARSSPKEGEPAGAEADPSASRDEAAASGDERSKAAPEPEVPASKPRASKSKKTTKKAATKKAAAKKSATKVAAAKEAAAKEADAKEATAKEAVATETDAGDDAPARSGRRSTRRRGRGRKRRGSSAAVDESAAAAEVSVAEEPAEQPPAAEEPVLPESADTAEETTDAESDEATALRGPRRSRAPLRRVGRLRRAQRPATPLDSEEAAADSEEPSDSAEPSEAAAGDAEPSADEVGSRRTRSRRGGRRAGRRRSRADAETVSDAEDAEDAAADAEREAEPASDAEMGGRTERRGRRGRRRAAADDAAEAASPEFDAEAEDENEGTERRGRRGRRRSTRAGSGEAARSAGRGAAQAEKKKAVLRRILVDAMDEEEVRIGVVDDGRLEQLFYERPAEKKYLGNIYKGRVVNIEPGIQAAFVDIGIGRNGFLHVSDVLPVYKDAEAVPVDSLSQRLGARRRMLIQDILRKGQEILVQISKDSIGMKGPSLTTYVSVPGKYLVLMPGVSRYGVSKRIQDYEERALLRKKLADLDPPEGMGYIVRTAGQDESEEVLAKDFRYLMEVWDQIREGVRTRKAPAMLVQEHDLVTRALRDLFGAEVEEIFIDEAEVYEQAKRFLLDVMPQAAKRLKHYTGATPLFAKFGVESQIESIYNRRITLPSGGWIVIEQTEALVAIDVNSGKYRDEEDLEATALHTNLEAEAEICRQLRLRDLGGVIIIDFIDMEDAANRRELERAVKASLKDDKAKSWITRVSRFGIIEMTRQRVRPSFETSNHEACEACRGTGWVKASRSVGTSILRRLRGELSHRRRQVCEVIAAPRVAEYLLNDRRRTILELEEEFRRQIIVRSDADLSPEEYSVRYR